MAINSICIEYRKKDSDELGEDNPQPWKLYKYVAVSPDEGGGSELLLMRKAFGEFYEFRIKIYCNEKPVVMIYSNEAKDWVQV